MSVEPTNTPPAGAPQVSEMDEALAPRVKEAAIGGQAVLEGVMMRGVGTWAVAVRLPHGKPRTGDAAASNGAALNGASANGASSNGASAGTNGTAALGEGWVEAVEPHLDADGNPLGEIDVHREQFVSALKTRRWMRLPVVRGVVALVESLRIGLGALGISANSQLDEPEEEISGRTWGVTIFISLAFAIGLFFVLPVTLANIWKDDVGSSVAFVVLEKLIRISIFLGYLWAISRIKDLRRVFEYHGAEHKVISCFEAGDPLEPEYAQRHSRFHVRCGTSFLLIVMIVAVFVFAPIGRPALQWLILSRVLGMFVVTGIAYEIIRWAGKHRTNRWVRGIMWPGLQLQRLTTREPSLDQLEVSIAALSAVLEVEDPSKVTDEDRLGMEVVA
jgi:uncharacterized protein YqhQ